MTVTLHLGDCVKWAREYSGEPFHALLCDPPYHLTSNEINYRLGPTPRQPSDRRGKKGFMGKQWDGGDVAFDPATWEAFGRIMYPGAFGMAFASSRGWHRLACAIEDAGFVIHPSMFGWAFGQGFPKATRVDTQIDKEAGAEREVIESIYANRRPRPGNGSTIHMPATGGETAPATPLAAAFAGHRYGLQALKPALEPIIVFQKPYQGRPIDNITATGAGCLNVDGGRIDLQEGETTFGSGVSQSSNPSVSYGDMGTKRVGVPNIHSTQGRWPANFYLDAEAAARLDEQSGNNRGAFAPVKRGHNGDSNGIYGDFASKGDDGETFYSDSGGASRFFFTVREQLDDADPVRYVAKASRRERDAGLEGMPLTGGFDKNTSKMIAHINHETGETIYNEYKPSEYRNSHPTVKPLALARYLATLLLPPAEYAPRRLFVPFAGVASECIGAMQAGWEDVQGVELTEEYIPIAQARVEYWKDKTQMVMPL